MANIKNELNNIKGALYGKDVRSSIHDGIDAINKEVESTTGRQEHLETTFDQLTINAGNSNAEIVDARVDKNGKSYAKLGDRLNEVDSQLEHITKQRIVMPENFGANPYASATTNTQAIQDALNLKGTVYLGTKGTYLINDTLIINDDTTFILGEGVILKQNDFANKNILVNRGYIESARNKNISIIGGTFDFNGSNQNAGGLNAMAIILKGIDNLTIKNTKNINTLKYCFLLADITNLYVNNINFNTYSDGLHLQPPINYADISNLYGTTGDDLLAFTGGDFADYDISRGDFTNIIARNLFPNNSLTAVKITGNPDGIFDNILIDGIFGSVQHEVVYIRNDKDLLQTKIKDLTIQNVDVIQPTNYINIRIDGVSTNYPQGDSEHPIIINNLTLKNIVNNNTRGFLTSQYYVEIDNLVIEDIKTNDIIIDTFFKFDKYSNVKNLNINKMLVNLGDEITRGIGLYINSNIDNIKIDNIICKSNNANVVFIWHRNVNVKNINISNVEFIGITNGNSLYMQEVEGTNYTLINLNNIYIDNIQQLLNLYGKTNINMNNIFTANLKNTLVNINKTQSVNIKANNVNCEKPHYIAVSNGGKANVNGESFKCHINLLTPNQYDIVYNIDSSLSCGSGKVIYNQGTWKNLFTDATYTL